MADALDQKGLAPCPFCSSDMAGFAGMAPEAFAKGSDGTFAVNCDCGAMGPPSDTMEGAITAWNRRASVITAEIAGVVEDLRGHTCGCGGPCGQKTPPYLREAATLIERLAASQAETNGLISPAIAAIETFLSALEPAAPGGGQACATEGCDNPATNEFIRGDVGSFYCGDCFAKVIEACEARPAPEGAVAVSVADIKAWRAEWLDANDPQDGTDCVTPFDKYLYTLGRETEILEVNKKDIEE